MAKDEALREALIELDTLRKREANALRESKALVQCLSAVATASDPEIGLARLLDAIKEVVACDVVAMVKGADGGDATVVFATDRSLISTSVPSAVLRGKKARRIVSLRDAAWWSDVRGWPEMGSALLSPVRLDGANGALICLARQVDGFSAADANILTQLSDVAAHGLATVDLARRNAFLAGVIDGSAASVAIGDLRQLGTPLVYVNDAFTTLSGYRREEALGRNCRFLSAEPEGSDIRTNIRIAVNNAAVGEFELRNRRKNGEEFWNRLTLYPIAGDDGSPRYIVATQVDITAEKNAEAAREEAAKRLRSALGATSEGFLLLNPQGKIAVVNRRYKDFFETEHTDWSEENDFTALWKNRLIDLGEAEEDAAKKARDYCALLYSNEPDREAELPDGRIVLIKNRPTAEGGVVSIATDVTSLKANERIMAQRAAAIDASQDGIAVADNEGRLLYANASYLAMYGYEHQYELLGKSWRTAFSEDQWERIEREAIPAIKSKGAWRAEVPGISKTGEQVLQEVSVTLAAGIGVVCVVRDMKQRARARSERALLIEQLQSAQRQEAIGQLAAGVAHDFNNVLSAITGSAALIEADIKRGRPVEDHVARILQAGVQAQGLIKRLLDFGSRRSIKEQADLRDLVTEAFDLLRSGVSQQISLTLDVPDQRILAAADPTDLTQIVLNLGINARDAIGEAEGQISISLDQMKEAPNVLQVGALDAQKNYAVIRVRDTGSGMAPEQIEKVFQAYYSTKGDGGTGLGLSVVSTIVKGLGGAISISSAPGAGTEFAIYYPTEQSAAPKTPKFTTPTSSANLSGKLILICDDNISVAETHAAILESAGAETAVVEDPRDALDALQEDPESWDALLTDFDMPHMNGAELAAAARAARGDLPIVLCTAYDLHRRSSTVFDVELEKPALPAALIGALATATTAAQGEREE
ncbi:MAG: PAS domain S-box protein [Pikeienuella sp.]